MSTILDQIVRLATANRVTYLSYLKPGERANTERWVEPYRLQESGSNLMVQCWQLSPDTHDHTKWRNFRIDRITGVADGGQQFAPRIPITLGAGEVSAFQWGHEPAVTLGPAAVYFNYLEQCMLDGTVLEEEYQNALALGQPVPPDERRGVHARVFANVLQEVLQDSAVTAGEAKYLADVRRFLDLLGWAP